MTAATTVAEVLRLAECNRDAVAAMLRRYRLQLKLLATGVVIAGSYWGESEAGLMGDDIYARLDTPLHSVLHEACHFVCMDASRRAQLERDAGGNVAEENAVCYLQIILADALADTDRHRMMQDMDAWGYTFRLGSAQAWFEQDASDAHAWLLTHGLIESHGAPTWRVRA